jgi:hypothetical protein
MKKKDRLSKAYNEHINDIKSNKTNKNCCTLVTEQPYGPINTSYKNIL